jgi:hypothetical protein
MKDLIEVFRMEEISLKTRASIIIKLGTAINAVHCMNITEPVVFELVKLLDPKNDILTQERYKRAR